MIGEIHKHSNRCSEKERGARRSEAVTVTATVTVAACGDVTLLWLPLGLRADGGHTHVPPPPWPPPSTKFLCFTRATTIQERVRPCVLVTPPVRPLVINIVKINNTPDGNVFLALGRVFTSTVSVFVSVGEWMKVLGEAYTQED